jgi:hypothetical protein
MGAVAVKQRVIFEAQPGPQSALISCPIEDVFFGGARGGGKTYALLGDWISHADLYREHARGIFFRRTYPELDEVQDQAARLFPSLGAVYNVAKRTWVFPTGAQLKMRFLERESDPDKYQGHAYTWMAFDELTNWPASKPIDKLRACLRSGAAPIPKSLRCSGNPGGVGHNWVKARYVDPSPPMKPFFDPEMECWRAFVPSKLEDNPALLVNDPDYWKRVVASANGDEALLKAWRLGDWDIVAGGMFDDLWIRSKHIVEPFPIPSSWTIDRSFDWGSSKPYSVGWWAESDGTTARNGHTYPRGTLFRIAEEYGWNGKPNEGCKALAVEVAQKVLEREREMGLTVNPGPADDAIWDEENGNCIARDMAQAGVYWTKAGKRPGTRRTGWEKLRKLLKAATAFPMEAPGLFVFSGCTHFIRTVPVLPRDKKQTDDVDTNAEDHIADETRYRVLQANVGHAY